MQRPGGAGPELVLQAGHGAGRWVAQHMASFCYTQDLLAESEGALQLQMLQQQVLQVVGIPGAAKVPDAGLHASLC